MERKPTKKYQGISALLPCTAGYRLPAFFTPFLMIGEVALEVMIPLLMAALVDGGLYHEETYQLKELLSLLPIGNNLQFVLWTGGLMVLASLLSLTFGALAARTSAVASMGFAKNLRHALFERIQSFSFRNTDRFQTSSLVMRTTTDVNNLQNIYQQLLRIFVRTPVMLILAATMAFRINAELAVIFVFAIPVIAAVMYVMKSADSRAKAVFAGEPDSARHHVDLYAGSACARRHESHRAGIDAEHRRPHESDELFDAGDLLPSDAVVPGDRPFDDEGLA